MCIRDRYCIYCGLTYFIPFLNQIYLLPTTAVGMYGIINQYGLKMVGGPVGGFMSDKVHKSAAKHIRVGFLVCILAMVGFLMVPHEALGQSGSWMLGAACTLGFGAIVFTMRAVFFAPMDEVKVPEEITGADVYKRQALRGGLIFLSAVTIAAGVLCLIFVPDDEKRLDENGKELNKAQAAFGGMMQALKLSLIHI